MTAAPLYFNRDGQEISLDQWTELIEDDGYRVVAQHYLKRRSDSQVGMLSTVWLGLNHTPHRKEKSIFETMLFPKVNDSETHPAYHARYATQQQAVSGHMKSLRSLCDGDALWHSIETDEARVLLANLEGPDGYKERIDEVR